MKILELNGLKYSRNEFDGYNYRAKILLHTVNDEYAVDIYTTDESKESVEQVIADRRRSDVVSVRIIHWCTKEQDDMATAFINEIEF